MRLCIYCQKNRATTKDHVPPQGMFPKPRPANLITVPCCEPCNRGFKNDDEYFLIMALEWTAAETSDGSQIAAGRLRDMNSLQRRRFWHRVFSRTRPVEVFTPGGLYLGQSVEIRPQTDRIRRTLNRIIRGLYFKMTETALPPDALVASIQYSTYVKEQGHDPSAQRIIEGMIGLPAKVIGKDTFQYRYYVLDPITFVSIWYLEFYRRHAFVGTTRAAGLILDGKSPSEG